MVDPLFESFQPSGYGKLVDIVRRMEKGCLLLKGCVFLEMFDHLWGQDSRSEKKVNHNMSSLSNIFREERVGEGGFVEEVDVVLFEALL